MTRQKKIAVINDFSGFGRCSLTVSIPIISAMGMQCCPLPTAILSNHTGYEDFFFDDYTDKMQLYYHQWEKLGLRFDGIYSGFLGSERQVEIVEDFIQRFSSPETAVIIDPVMGDDGRIYTTLTRELCRRLKRLAAGADIITPNITETCILTGLPYTKQPDSAFLLSAAEKLRHMGSRNIVITGIDQGNTISNFIYREDGTYTLLSAPMVSGHRAGTGDVFASIIAADRVNGIRLEDSVRRAADFVAHAIVLSDEEQIPAQDGICFERIIGELIP